MPKDFYIFRHGQSTYNVDGRIQGQTNDSVLTDLGKSQALKLGEKLKGRGIEVIISSPLTRAMQTAEMVNKNLNVPVVADEHFIEVDVGIVEGMAYKDVMKQYKDIFDKLHSTNLKDNFDVCYPQGETKRQVRQRMLNGLNNWCHCVNNYKIMAVSSHGIALSQISSALGQRFDNIENCAVLHIAEDNGHWKIIEKL